MKKITNLNWIIPSLGAEGSIFDWLGNIEKAGPGNQHILENLKARSVLSVLERYGLIRFYAKKVEIPEDDPPT